MPVVNLLDLDKEESIKSMINIDRKQIEQNSNYYLFFVTKDGLVKRVHINEFQRIRQSGKIAICLKDNDQLVQVKLTSGNAVSYTHLTGSDSDITIQTKIIKDEDLTIYETGGVVLNSRYILDICLLYTSIENIELVAILGREKSREKIEKIVNQHHIKKAYYDYNELLNDSQIDTIYIALPNHLHYEYTKKALLHNKHVICEKPFTSNVIELDELIKIAKQQNCLLFEAITNQYLPTYQDIKNKLDEIGKIGIISSNYSQYSSRYDAFKRGEILPVFDVNQSGGALMRCV